MIYPTFELNYNNLLLWSDHLDAFLFKIDNRFLNDYLGE